MGRRKVTKAMARDRASAHKHCGLILREIAALEKELAKHVRAAFPVGSSVAWDHGEHTRIATVVDHGWGQLRVEGETGTRYWIDARKVIRSR